MASESPTLELLELLFWALDKLARPTFSNLTESFESWEYRHKIRPHLRSLSRAGFIEFHRREDDAPIRLTSPGRLIAMGGVDPEARWKRSWDGQWRLVLFDLAGGRSQLRMRLWRWLRTQRFGYLQNSV